MLIPTGKGRFTLGVDLDVSLPSVEDQDRAVALVRDAHERCPYSGATRGNIDVVLSVNGVKL
jgi:lipoyl-dependent peroxiredoxin